MHRLPASIVYYKQRGKIVCETARSILKRREEAVRMASCISRDLKIGGVEAKAACIAWPVKRRRVAKARREMA